MAAGTDIEGQQVVRYREYPISEDLMVGNSGSVDVGLPVLA